MQSPKLGMKPLAEYLPLANNNSSNKRIRADPTPPALRKLKRLREMPPVRGCELAIHATD
jgi:hypothetical protein